MVVVSLKCWKHSTNLLIMYADKSSNVQRTVGIVLENEEGLVIE